MYQKQVDEEEPSHQGYQSHPQQATTETQQQQGYQGGYQQGYQQQGGYQQTPGYEPSQQAPPPQQQGYQQGGYQQGGYQQQGYQEQQYGVYAPPQGYQQGYQPPSIQPVSYAGEQGGYQQGGYQQGGGYQGAPPPEHHHHHDHDDHDDHDDKFADTHEYRDILWAGLFGAHLIAVLIVLIVAGSSSSGDATNTDPNTGGDDFLPWASIGKVFLVCMIAVIAAVVFSFSYITFIKRYAKQLIHITLYMGIAWCIILAIIGFAQRAVWVGIMFLIFAAINALFFYWWRSRIPFATAVLTTVSHILDQFPAPTYYAYASLVAQFFWVLLWMPTFVLVQRYHSNSAAVLSIFLIFSFYWTSQVIKNVVHVTTSGLVATWYFMFNLGMPANPTQKAFKRAVTTSFGSICLGSLVVAILKTIRSLVNSSRRNNGWAGFILSCILSILDQLIEYFNMYAFTQVAIYGKTYCHAAKDTWKLVKERGVDAIVNDNLISGVLAMGALMGGVATAVVGGIVAIIAIPSYWVSLAFVSFLIGVSLVMLTMEVVESGVATIFVCFAMDPAALQRNSPELYNTFISTYHGLHV